MTGQTSYYAYGLLAGNGGYVFIDNGKDLKIIGLANEGAIKVIEYPLKLGMAKEIPRY